MYRYKIQGDRQRTVQPPLKPKVGQLPQSCLAKQTCSSNVGGGMKEAPRSATVGLEGDGMREAETARHKAWLAQITENWKSDGLKITVEVESSDNWREAIAPAAQRAKADLIVKANYRRSVIQRRLFQTSDWVLLRSAHCPVLFVKAKRTKPRSWKTSLRQ